jgi:UDP-glucose 4-epimerase
MQSIITGGGGFIGSHLAERLVKLKHKVVIIDNFSIGRLKNLKNIKDKIRIINKDITNEKDISKYFKGADNVFHLAALADIVPSIENPKLYFETNVKGTLNVLNCSVENKVKRFIYIASSSCYGIPKKYPTPETSDILPQYPYALTKRMGEELVLHYANVYNLNSTSLRFFNVYGPRARTSGTYGAVFGVFLAQKFSGNPLTVVGNGKQTRDFTYVSDVVDAIIATFKNKKIKGEIFNVGSGKTISINKIVNLLNGKKIHIPKRPGEPDSTFADISKIKKKIGWKPKINIETGINNLLEDISIWKDAPIWSPKTIKKATKKWFYYLKK